MSCVDMYVCTYVGTYVRTVNVCMYDVIVSTHVKRNYSLRQCDNQPANREQKTIYKKNIHVIEELEREIVKERAPSNRENIEYI